MAIFNWWRKLAHLCHIQTEGLLKKKKNIYIYIYFETEVNVIGFKSCGIYIAFIFYHILNKKKRKKELSYRVPYIIN